VIQKMIFMIFGVYWGLIQQLTWNIQHLVVVTWLITYGKRVSELQKIRTKSEKHVTCRDTVLSHAEVVCNSWEDFQQVVVYQSKSFYVTLAAWNFFQIIYIQQFTILPIVKKLKKPDNITILLLGGIVYRKKPLQLMFLYDACWCQWGGRKCMLYISYYMGLGSIRQEKLA
jgi:hypothetical protein